jgi:hypothetical protein
MNLQENYLKNDVKNTLAGTNLSPTHDNVLQWKMFNESRSLLNLLFQIKKV